MVYYALKTPTGKASYNYFLLLQATRYKRFYVGTFYFLDENELRPVFNIPYTRVSEEAFERIPVSKLKRAYKMLCLNCGRCCAVNSGAFAFKGELEKILEKLNISVIFPSDIVEVDKVGKVKIYWLDVGKRGRCYFYTPDGCLIEKEASHTLKPIICLIHYCTMFAERNGNYYIKVSVKNVNGKTVPVYRKTTLEELKEIAKRVKESTLKGVVWEE